MEAFICEQCGQETKDPFSVEEPGFGGASYIFCEVSCLVTFYVDGGTTRYSLDRGELNA